ncbi:hypothetical protein DFH07DRAFT_35292 [Mycena maculata]|uniref:Zn(2)-C6 fungal-type domain-containing protein n=1 Tax=Mycena maculata TaxID=230809 RepID=A0AAD7N391_9AGAR|nr:hypothetical protein DFH07DRAFT_35292 [Mycena maculata]
MQAPRRAGPQLPSIRTLHPYLPPPPPIPAPDVSSGPQYSPVTPNPAPSYANPNPPSSYAGSDPDADTLELGAEQDRRDAVVDGSGEPPKKKRRRQALSCTECKRRKIRCDRTQPCAPCVRRGDQEKCQWHVVEPVYPAVCCFSHMDFIHPGDNRLTCYLFQDRKIRSPRRTRCPLCTR